MTRSDSEASSTFGQEGPILYRLRADGRKVPITDGQGMDLARRKGLIQEVVVSPKGASKSLANANSVFGPEMSQPETVVLHSVELPQVQLGDREIADTPPEKAGNEDHAANGSHLPKSLESHPSLLQLQQEQSQAMTNRLMSECGLEPRSHSESVAQSSRNSPEIESISQSLSRISSLNGFPPDSALAREMAGTRSGSAVGGLFAQNGAAAVQHEALRQVSHRLDQWQLACTIS